MEILFKFELNGTFYYNSDSDSDSDYAQVKHKSGYGELVADTIPSNWKTIIDRMIQDKYSPSPRADFNGRIDIVSMSHGENEDNERDNAQDHQRKIKIYCDLRPKEEYVDVYSIDPEDCRCTDCIIGDRVAFYSASSGQLKAMLRGEINDYSEMSRKEIKERIKELERIEEQIRDNREREEFSRVLSYY